MYKVWKVLRGVITVLLLVATGVPALLYVLLSFDGVQNKVREITATELSHLLGARVSIGNLGVRPFNRVSLTNIALVDSTDTDTIATVGRISAGLELWKLLRHGDIVVDYALLDGASVRIHREDPTAPLNIQPIIDHLKSDRPRERETPFELSINTVIVRRGELSYDILNAPAPDSSRFAPAHIRVSDIALNAYIPVSYTHLTLPKISLE
ncbi:MAG: hypothetical protein K2L16_02920 [Muribaculaceae bacterium]|nr:hypothetical protein [Muribaculaceae bacterium]